MNKKQKVIYTLLLPVVSFLTFTLGYIKGHTERGLEREYREVELQLISQGINPEQGIKGKNKEIAEAAFYCREQLTLAMERLTDNEDIDSNILASALDHIITAKGFLEKLKKLGVPTKRYEEDLRAAEVAFKMLREKK